MNIEKFVVGFLNTNCYVVSAEGDNTAVIIDPGGGYASVKYYLEKKSLVPVAVLCTHGHFDHVHDAKRWQNEGVKIYIHSSDIELITGEKETFEGYKLATTPTSPDFTIKDGDILNFGNMSFKVIYTPGHTMGSVCYVLNDEYIFSGDTIFFHSFGRTDFYGGDHNSIVASVNKILNIGKDMIIYPGHEESTTVAEEKRFNPLYAR